MADNPQETIRELRDLVLAYAKQETVDELKGIGRYAGFGIGAALMSGFGAIFVSVGLLRLIEDETGVHLTGNWSWVPYLGVIILSAGVAVMSYLIGTRRKR